MWCISQSIRNVCHVYLKSSNSLYLQIDDLICRHLYVDIDMNCLQFKDCFYVNLFNIQNQFTYVNKCQKQPHVTDVKLKLRGADRHPEARSRGRCRGQAGLPYAHRGRHAARRRLTWRRGHECGSPGRPRASPRSLHPESVKKDSGTIPEDGLKSLSDDEKEGDITK